MSNQNGGSTDALPEVINEDNGDLFNNILSFATDFGKENPCELTILTIVLIFLLAFERLYKSQQKSDEKRASQFLQAMTKTMNDNNGN